MERWQFRYQIGEIVLISVRKGLTMHRLSSSIMLLLFAKSQSSIKIQWNIGIIIERNRAPSGLIQKIAKVFSSHRHLPNAPSTIVIKVSFLCLKHENAATIPISSLAQLTLHKDSQSIKGPRSPRLPIYLDVLLSPWG